MFLDLFEINLLEEIEIQRWIFKRKTGQKCFAVGLLELARWY